MRKVLSLFRELGYLVREHKLYFLSPIIAVLCLMAVLFFHFGPGLIVTFIYAGG